MSKKIFIIFMEKPETLLSNKILPFDMICFDLTQFSK